MGAQQGCILFGVPAMKGLEDLHRYERAIAATQPDLVIQTGTAVGGSARWFAHHCIAYRGPHVMTVDIDRDRVHPSLHEDKDITVLDGDSTDEAVVAQVRAKARDYGRVMVVLDSDHSGAHVSEEIRLYSSLVSPGCYLVVEDGIYDLVPSGPFQPGPLDAIQANLVGDDRWERDVAIEAMEKVSMYPGGWWIRRA
jgi:cephalosporin hydroxylase